MKVDKETEDYFSGRVKQVFVYLTSRCQLRCEQCLYKPLLVPASTDIDFKVLINLLEIFKSYGARKVSYLGGEPTLYCDHKSQKRFGDVIKTSKDIGYRYVRFDTNGQFFPGMLDDDCIRLIDEITFSLDGATEELNDIIRGIGTYRRCVENIRYATSHGYKAQITSCVHRTECLSVHDGVDSIHNMIMLAQNMNVASINFHPIIKNGIPRDAWIGNTDVDPRIWYDVYRIIEQRVKEGTYSINVRLPMRYAHENEVNADPTVYHYCPVEMGERALIMPDGQIKICAFTIGTNECVARYDDDGIIFEKAHNETSRKLTEMHSNCFQQSDRDGLIPLCMSYKPHQDEFVWTEMLSLA